MSENDRRRADHLWIERLSQRYWKMDFLNNYTISGRRHTYLQTVFMYYKIILKVVQYTEGTSKTKNKIHIMINIKI